MTDLAAQQWRPDDDMVIGEAVVLDLHPTSFATRMAAILIDLLVLAVISVALLLVMFVALGAADAAALQAVTVALQVTVLVLVPAVVETLTRGRSVGKMALGLRVVRDDGGPVRARHAFIRAMVGVGELWLLVGSPAIICSLANDKGKRIGDLLAGTYVVNERSSNAPQVRIEMPQELAAWASAADIGRLPDHLAMSLRQFLARASTLHPGSRVTLGASLSEQTARLVAPAPPPGTHPERFMAAVVAERRERELARLTRKRAAAQRREQVLHRLPHGLDG